MAKKTPPNKTRDGFEVYQSDYWYWRLRRRGRIVADGSEGYSRRYDCVRAVKALRTWQRGAFVLITVMVTPARKRVFVR